MSHLRLRERRRHNQELVERVGDALIAEHPDMIEDILATKTLDVSKVSEDIQADLADIYATKEEIAELTAELGLDPDDSDPLLMIGEALDGRHRGRRIE
jgi:hypothetical protein